MTTVLSPVLPKNSPHNQVHGLDKREGPTVPKQDTAEYLADMLRELSAIAAWADLNHTRKFIDAALHELETKQDQTID